MRSGVDEEDALCRNAVFDDKKKSSPLTADMPWWKHDRMMYNVLPSRAFTGGRSQAIRRFTSNHKLIICGRVLRDEADHTRKRRLVCNHKVMTCGCSNAFVGCAYIANGYENIVTNVRYPPKYFAAQTALRLTRAKSVG